MCVRASVYCGLPTVPSATPLTQTECDAHVYVAHVWFRYGYVMVMVPPSTMLVCVCGRGAHVGRGEGLDPQPHNADGEARAQESSAEPYGATRVHRWVELEAGANKQTGASPRVGPSCTSNRSWCAAAPRAGPNGRLYCSRHGNHPEAVPILALPIVSNAPVPRQLVIPILRRCVPGATLRQKWMHAAAPTPQHPWWGRAWRCKLTAINRVGQRGWPRERPECPECPPYCSIPPLWEKV
jgi:hypothetical protein